MADSEASGEARLEDPVDDPVDTDRMAVDPSEDVGAPAPDAEFDYLLNEQDYAVVPNGASDVEPLAFDDDNSREPGWVAPAPPPDERTFDAFNASTWNFKPAPAPWYRTGHTGTVLVAVSIAAVALVVSGVLLAFRGTSEGGDTPTTSPGASSVPTTATATASPTAELTPPPAPPPPPPPPPPPTASEINQAPVYQRPQQDEPTRKPEINVTRAPMSVHPQMPGKRP